MRCLYADLLPWVSNSYVACIDYDHSIGAHHHLELTMIKQCESFVCYSRIGYANKLVYYIRVVDVLDDSIYDAKVVY